MLCLVQCVPTLSLSPFDASARVKEQSAATEASEREFRAAHLDKQLLQRDALQRAQEEEARDGLVILAAFYGDVQACSPFGCCASNACP